MKLHKPTFQIQYPLFLDEADSEYATNKKIVKKLIKLKTESGKTDWQITEFLWSSGYYDVLSHDDVVKIFAKEIIPSEQLLYHLQCFFTGNYLISLPEPPKEKPCT